LGCLWSGLPLQKSLFRAKQANVTIDTLCSRCKAEEASVDILIIGGTQFVGRHLVEAALAAGHRVSLFNRGRTNPGLYPEAEHLIGDRDGGLDALRGRRWDAVVDICGYVPRIVRQSAELLRDQVERYVWGAWGQRTGGFHRRSLRCRPASACADAPFRP
jgi:hypothetical protein